MVRPSRGPLSASTFQTRRFCYPYHSIRVPYAFQITRPLLRKAKSLPGRRPRNRPEAIERPGLLRQAGAGRRLRRPPPAPRLRPCLGPLVRPPPRPPPDATWPAGACGSSARSPACPRSPPRPAERRPCRTPLPPDPRRPARAPRRSPGTTPSPRPAPPPPAAWTRTRSRRASRPCPCPRARPRPPPRSCSGRRAASPPSPTSRSHRRGSRPPFRRSGLTPWANQSGAGPV